MMLLPYQNVKPCIGGEVDHALRKFPSLFQLKLQLTERPILITVWHDIILDLITIVEVFIWYLPFSFANFINAQGLHRLVRLN